VCKPAAAVSVCAAQAGEWAAEAHGREQRLGKGEVGDNQIKIKALC